MFKEVLKLLPSRERDPPVELNVTNNLSEAFSSFTFINGLFEPD